MDGACPNCLASHGRIQIVQQDRPCPLCAYTGDWNGWCIFTTGALRHSFVSEANMAAHALAEQIIMMQERTPEIPN